jgi:WD40 repeat protein
VATGSLDRTVIIWDMNNGKRLFTLTEHESYITNVIIGTKIMKIITVSNDALVIIWDLNTGKKIISLDHQRSTANSIALSDDNTKLLTYGISDETVILWDVSTG